MAEVIKLVGLTAEADKLATNLSGGQQQRASLARAIVAKPRLLLFDEPLSNLDLKLREQMRVELKRIHADLGATLLYVTHDQVEAMTMASHVGVLDSGRLVQVGTPREIYETPLNTYVASRLGLPRINLLPADLFPGAPTGARTIGLRPEHMIQTPGPDGDGQDASVTRVEHLGDQTRLHLVQ